MKACATSSMLRVRLLSLAPMAMVALTIGCQQSKTADPAASGVLAKTPASTPLTSSSESKPSASSTASPPTAQTSPTSPTAAKGPSEADVPANLKSDGYLYYGLGYSKPMKMAITESDDPHSIHTGTQTITLKEIKNGTPIYAIERTGDLAGLGSQEVRLEKDAIYNSASTIAKIGPHDVEMPAKLPLGSTWKSHLEVVGSQSITSDSVYKVERFEKVKTPVEETEALLISSTGQGTINGKKVKLDSKQWFVKGRGNVKLVLNKTGDDKKTITFQIQETN